MRSKRRKSDVCGSCAHWHAPLDGHDNGYGQCRHSAPRGLDAVGCGIWPKTHHTWWCGCWVMGERWEVSK